MKTGDNGKEEMDGVDEITLDSVLRVRIINIVAKIQELVCIPFIFLFILTITIIQNKLSLFHNSFALDNLLL
jgi:hypothetical protein